MKKETEMEWNHTLAIIATILSTAYYIHQDITTDMKTQSARTDRLYEMFIDLVKETRK